MSITYQVCSLLEPQIVNYMLENQWESMGDFSPEAWHHLQIITINKFYNDPQFNELMLMDEVLNNLVCGRLNDAQNLFEEVFQDIFYDALEHVCNSKIVQINLWTGCFDKNQTEEDEENRAQFDREEAQSINSGCHIPGNSLNNL